MTPNPLSSTIRRQCTELWDLIILRQWLSVYQLNSLFQENCIISSDTYYTNILCGVGHKSVEKLIYMHLLKQYTSK